ncbi:DedA family protein [Actinotalea solisilvae]|uniref:DedA family protein n=1 Tax=Actinotalea solisilvae TaxID=2072922 RepID=UPI0027DD1F42|nr:VTT domain-containing protein [Actinotalea solisilvae]
MLEGLEEWVVAMAATPWVFVALYCFATIDGFFPPIPSESVVIALAATSMASGHPNFWVLGAVAAAGAFTGDQIAYSIGRRVPVRDLRIMRGRRAQQALTWADKALAERGAAFIIAARYVPIGRVAVNMTAGAVGFSRLRFTALAAIAAVTWSIYSVLLGIGAGVWLKEHTLVAVAVGVVGGLLLGLIIDPVISWFVRRRLGRPERRAAVDDGGDDDQPAEPAAVAVTSGEHA